MGSVLAPQCYWIDSELASCRVKIFRCSIWRVRILFRFQSPFRLLPGIGYFQVFAAVIEKFHHPPSGICPKCLIGSTDTSSTHACGFPIFHWVYAPIKLFDGKRGGKLGDFCINIIVILAVRYSSVAFPLRRSWWAILLTVNFAACLNRNQAFSKVSTNFFCLVSLSAVNRLEPQAIVYSPKGPLRTGLRTASTYSNDSRFSVMKLCLHPLGICLFEVLHRTAMELL